MKLPIDPRLPTVGRPDYDRTLNTRLYELHRDIAQGMNDGADATDKNTAEIATNTTKIATQEAALTDHKTSGDHDARYYTRGQSDTALATKYDKTNILGTVSQSGGVPTGAIIESGSNGNGRYVKWADGTLECFAPFPAGVLAVETAYGAMYRSPSLSWTFPAAFVGNRPVVTGSIGVASGGIPGVSVVSSTLTGAVFYVLNPVNYTASIGYDMRAIGRWF